MQPALNRSFTFETWREAVRPLLAAREKPDGLLWRDYPPLPAGMPTVCLPRSLMSLLENLACFRHPSRWELMYRLAWRTLWENSQLLLDVVDSDVLHANSMDRAVRRDLHKMHAFVRFREVVSDGGESSYFAWFEPQHEIVRKGAKFFEKRFPNMQWTIATPDETAVWDKSVLTFVDSRSLERPAGGDVNEELWRTYYRSICNVARINPVALQREMPQRYWRNLPEAVEIPTLVREGAARFAACHEQSDHFHITTSKSLQHSLADARQPADDLQSCQGCELWKRATQAVKGEGPIVARIMLVGEQPGDQEDLQGAPFVGPAGQVLDSALLAANLRRADLYVTNAVKHFKWESRGKRRIHKRPSVGEIRACNGWLQREIGVVQPRVIVTLGATALLALNGAAASIEDAQRLQMRHPDGALILAAYHPSAILRSDQSRAGELRASLVRTLEIAGRMAESDPR